MGSFYGNISASNRTAFTFDKIYGTRQAMDAGCASDGIFIGRYVLVEYDNPPITGYYFPDEDEFYGDVHHEQQHSDDNNIYINSNTPNRDTKLIKTYKAIYQDLGSLNSANSFYICDYAENSSNLTYIPYTGSTSAFATAYNADVRAYGRGYDSTVWLKTINTDTGNYRYVLIAELNTVVPNFHLIVDPPTITPMGPYFDGNTTNLDYYLHVPGSIGFGINILNNSTRSDEEVVYRANTYDAIHKAWNSEILTGNGQIYFNRAGFSRNTNNYDADGGRDSINYNFVASGFPYYGETNAANNNGVAVKDQYLWYINLPSIGNTIAEVWNVMYTNDRYLQFLKEEFDNYAPPNAVYCTVDSDSVLGIVNTARCYLGRVYSFTGGEFIYNENENAYYLQGVESGGTLEFNKRILYKDTVTANVNNRTYYYPSFTNRWVQDNNGDYYFDATDGAYKLANPAIVNNSVVRYRRELGYNNDASHPYWRYCELYTAEKLEGRYGAGLAAVEADKTYGAATTILGGLALINRIVGIGLSDADSRDDRTLIGMINRTKDMVSHIDAALAPNKLVATNAQGQIFTTTTPFPTNTSTDGKNDTLTSNNVGNGILNNLGIWQQPVNYKLWTLNLMNTQDNTKYFDSGYYGNSCLHAVLATDSLGEAIKKMQNEMADIQYIQQTIDTFTANANTAGEDYNGGVGKMIENGRNISSVVLNYTLNKGPRQRIVLTRIAPNVTTPIYIEENINPEYYVTNASAYASSASQTKIDNNAISNMVANSTLTWKLEVTDERNYVATKTVSLNYTNKVYWGVGSAQAASAFNNYTNLSNLLSNGGNALSKSRTKTFTANAGNNQYLYYIFPTSYGTPIFTVGGFAGGFDKIGEVDFTNASGYTVGYQVWRSNRANLGNTTVVVS